MYNLKCHRYWIICSINHVFGREQYCKNVAKLTVTKFYRILLCKASNPGLKIMYVFINDYTIAK